MTNVLGWCGSSRSNQRPPAKAGARLPVLPRSGSLSGEEVAQALTFADFVVTTLLDGQERARTGNAADGLDDALGSQARLFQAQGMVMIQLGTDLTEALVRMRGYAYARDLHLIDVAEDILTRRLRFDRDHP